MNTKHSSRKKKMIIGLSILLSLIILFFTGFYFVQDSLMFYPHDDPESREYLSHLSNYREVEFEADGATYHGMMYLSDELPAPLVIYFGGNGENSCRHMRAREEHDEWRYFAGYSVVFMDYPGYGLNDGAPGTQSMYDEALAVFDWAAALPEVDSNRIVAMGYSIGTGSAVYLAGNRPVAGLMLFAPYANGYDLVNHFLPFFHGPLKLLVKNKFASDEYAGQVTAPVMIFASKNDEMVSFATSKKLAGCFHVPVDFIELQSERHNEIFGGEGVFDKIEAFLLKVRLG